MIVSRDTLRLLIKPDAEVSVACNHVSYGRVYFLLVTSCTYVDYRGRTRACTSCAFFVLARKHQLFLPVSGFPFFPVDVHLVFLGKLNKTCVWELRIQRDQQRRF